MSDTTTPPAPEPAPDLSSLDQGTLSRLIAQLTGPQAPPPVVSGSASSHDGRGFLSLLGEALGGGQQYGTTEEREQGGLAAAQAAGIRMLAASDYSRQPHTLGAIVAQGLGGAQQSLGQSQSVSAARQAAAFEQNRQQQQDQLARIKEAIPLLTLQQKMRAIQGLPATLGGGPGGGGSIATGGSISPFIATNLPEGVSPAEDQMVRTVIGEAGNQGTVGQQAVAAVIKNRMDAGKQGAQDVIFAPNQFEPWNNPKTRATLEAIDPNSKQYQDILNNAVRPVMAGTAKDPTGGATHFFSPTTQKALGRDAPGWAQGQTPTVIGQHNFYKLPYAPQAPAPGQTATAAPPPAPGLATPTPTRQPASPAGSIPPPTTAGGSALPPPEAPIAPGAGGAQIAGPGAPTAPVIPPSPPGSDATVADIRAGMVGAGADPTTLAVGPVPPWAAPGAATAGPAGPQAPAPGSYEEYRLLHPITPSADDLAGFRTTPDAEQIANIRKQAANAQTSYAAARANLDTAGMAKASDDYNTAIAKENELRQNAAKLGTDTRAKFMADQDKQRYDAWAKGVEDQRKQADAERTQQNAIRLKEIEGEQTRTTNREAVQNAAGQKLTEDLNTETTAARGRVGALEAVLELSRNVQDPTLMATKTIGGVPVVDLLKGLGIGSEAFQNKLSAIQALRAGIANVTKAMRQGVALGNASDADLRFITALGPSEMEDDSTREAIVANLLGQQHRLMRFNTEVTKQVSNGLKSGEAIDAADKKIPAVTPVFPKELQNAPRGDPAVKEWFDANVAPNTIWADANGKRHVFHAPGWTPPAGYRTQ